MTPEQLEKLRSVYNAARALNNQTHLQAAENVGKSITTIHQVLIGDMTSQPAIDAIREYCYKAGLRYTIEKLGLNPDQKAKTLEGTGKTEKHVADGCV